MRKASFYLFLSSRPKRSAVEGSGWRGRDPSVPSDDTRDDRRAVSGFTLLELMLVIALVAVLAAFSIPAALSFLRRNDLAMAANAMTQAERRASLLAQAMDGDASWGVKAQTGGITLFRGTSFSLRDASQDETTSISNALSVSGLSEIVFGKWSGLPLASGTTTFTGSDGDVASVVLNEKGMATY